mgnify:CR=1 FL=1
MSVLGMDAVSRTTPFSASHLTSRRPQGQRDEGTFAALLSSASVTASPPQLVTNSARLSETGETQSTQEPLDGKTVERERFTNPGRCDDEEVEKVFQQFVGRTFFGLMLKEMRKSIHKTPYFHGGLAEEVFEQHLDMTLAEKLAESSGEQFSKPMYELFRLQARK